MESDCVTINKIDSYAINFIFVYLMEFQFQASFQCLIGICSISACIPEEKTTHTHTRHSYAWSRIDERLHATQIKFTHFVRNVRILRIRNSDIGWSRLQQEEIVGRTIVHIVQGEKNRVPLIRYGWIDNTHFDFIGVKTNWAKMARRSIDSDLKIHFIERYDDCKWKIYSESLS